MRGTWTDQLGGEPTAYVLSAFSIEEFLVLAVGGRPAMDGVLGQDAGRYYLEPTGGGDVFWFTDAPSEFDANIGKRIWVTGSAEDPPLTFAAIE